MNIAYKVGDLQRIQKLIVTRDGLSVIFKTPIGDDEDFTPLMDVISKHALRGMKAIQVPERPLAYSLEPKNEGESVGK